MIVLLSAPVLGCWTEKPEDWDDELDGVFEPCQENEEFFDPIPSEAMVIQNNVTEAHQVFKQLEELTKTMGEQIKELQNEVSILNNEMNFMHHFASVTEFMTSVMFRIINETQYEELIYQVQEASISKPRRLPWEKYSEENRKNFIKLMETLISQHQNKE